MSTRKQKAGPANADVNALITAWGLPLDGEMLVLALTHRSFANEKSLPANNERLEFLGDSVLSIVVTDHLFHEFADLPESDLAKFRASIVSQAPLAEVARSLDLGSFVLLGVGENKTGGRDKASILSDTLEALIGASYLTHGLEPTRKTLLKHLKPIISRAGETASILDWKTPLREVAQIENLGLVHFIVRGEGPDHNKFYYAEAYGGEELLGTGSGPSKKLAENDAAKAAYLVLRPSSDAD